MPVEDYVGYTILSFVVRRTPPQLSASHSMRASAAPQSLRGVKDLKIITNDCSLPDDIATWPET